MKRILPAALLAMCAIASGCSGNNSKTACDGESLKSKIENCTDRDSLTMYVKQAKSHAERLIKTGKADEARKYIDDVTPAVEKQSPTLRDEWARAVRSIGLATESTADSIGSKAAAAADSVKSKTGDAAKKVKEKSAEIYDDAKDGVKEGAKDVKDAADEALKKLKGE